jgi:hypothetical protein
VEVLPALSTANVREMLKAVMPLPQLSPQEARAQVVKHLVSRLRRRHRKNVNMQTLSDIVKLGITKEEYYSGEFFEANKTVIKIFYKSCNGYSLSSL